MSTNPSICPVAQSTSSKMRLSDDIFSKLMDYAVTLASLSPIAMKARRIGNKPTNTDLSSREYGILMSQSVTIDVHTQLAVLLTMIMEKTDAVRLGVSSNGGMVCFNHASKDTFSTYLTPQQIIKLFGPLMKSIKAKLQAMKPQELTDIGIDIISCRDASFSALALHRAGVNCTSIQELNQCSAFFFSLSGSRGLKDPVYSSIYEENTFKSITVTFEESKDRVRINGGIVSPIYSKARIGAVATAKSDLPDEQLSESDFTPAGVPSSRKKLTKTRNAPTTQSNVSSSQSDQSDMKKKKKSATTLNTGKSVTIKHNVPVNKPIPQVKIGRTPLPQAPEVQFQVPEPTIDELTNLDRTPDSEKSDDDGSDFDNDFVLNKS